MTSTSFTQSRRQRCFQGFTSQFDAERLEERKLLSTSAFSFGLPVLYQGLTGPIAVTAADFNGDGKQDLAVMTRGGDADDGSGDDVRGEGVCILLNRGDGSVGSPNYYPTGPVGVEPSNSYPRAMAVADFNGDNRPDVALVDYQGPVWVLLNKGNGTLAPCRSYFGNWLVTGAAAADFNSDGTVDLAIGTGPNDGSGGNSTFLMLNSGDGSFDAIKPVWSGVDALTSLDLNADGKPDLVALSRLGPPSIRTFINHGDGTFDAGAITDPVIENNGPDYFLSGPRKVIAADLDGNGRDDLVIITSTGLRVLLNGTDGTFRGVSLPTGLGDPPSAVNVGDVNGDGKPDLVAAGFSGSSDMSVMLNEGDGKFGAPSSVRAAVPPDQWPGIDDLALADLNGDARPDLITAELGRSGVVVRLNAGSVPPVDTSAVQAETSVVSGAVFSTTHIGFTGTGYIDYTHASGDFVEFKVTAPSAGTFALDFRYANGSAPRAMALKVNGAVIRPRLSFAGTGSWSDWGVVTLNTPLKAGVNTIRLTAVGQSGPNLDALTVRKINPYIDTVQAERIARSGAVADNRHAGFNGSGYIDFQHPAGDWIEWTANVPTAGAYRLEVRFANGGAADRRLALKVNGAAASNVAFARTGGWSVWKTTSLAVQLTAGLNRIRLTTAGAEGPNIDLLALRPI